MTNRAPTIGVAIATCNRADLLRRAVLSSLSQTDPPTEIVICDDVSTDSTPELLATLAHDYPTVRYVRNTERVYGGKTFDAAIRAATADYLCLLHDDDYLLPGALAAYRQLIGRHPEAAAFFPSHAVIGPGQQIVEYRHIFARETYLPSDQFLSNLLLLLQFCFTSTGCLVRRDRILEVGGIAGYRWPWDHDFIYHLMRRWAVVYTAQFQACYVLGEEDCTGKFFDGHEKQLIGYEESAQILFEHVDAFVRERGHQPHDVRLGEWIKDEFVAGYLARGLYATLQGRRDILNDYCSLAGRQRPQLFERTAWPLRVLRGGLSEWVRVVRRRYGNRPVSSVKLEVAEQARRCFTGSQPVVPSQA